MESMTDTWSRASAPNGCGNSGRANSICDRCLSNRKKRYGIWRRRRMVLDHPLTLKRLPTALVDSELLPDIDFVLHDRPSG